MFTAIFVWPLIVLGLVFLASLSPLLTFTWLFQLKEWRMDRLQEHLRREGWISQLIGKIRTLVLGAYIVFIIGALILTIIQDAGIDAVISTITVFCMPLVLMILAAISVFQIATKRQRTPDWTKKALLTIIVSIIMTLFFTLILLQPIGLLALPFVPILQPLSVVMAWILLLPLDHFLKQRTFQQARIVRNSLDNPIVIGIVGSVGKTTVKELLATVLSDLDPLVTPAHVNTEMGVSQWFIKQFHNSQLTTHNSQLIIIEMGAYRTGEIALLSSIVQPTIGVVTALGSDHLALFGSEEAIIEANGEILTTLPQDGHAFLYGDNPATASLKKQCACPSTLVGMQSHDLQAENIQETEEGLTFDITPHTDPPIPNTQYSILNTFATPLHGTHNIGNILLAIAVARHFGIEDGRIAELLASHHPLKNTFNVQMQNGVLLLDDSYNISPLSLRAAIDWAEKQKNRPRILLTSGLLETGKEEDRFHEELGMHAKGKIERVIFTTNRGRQAFAKGFGQSVELLTPQTVRAEPDSAVVCVGRMPPATIRQMMANE